MSSPEYGALLAAPPWHFRTWSANGKGRSRTYDTMSFEELADMPIVSMAAPDCALFMWVIDSHLQDALDLIQAWQFQYKTIGFIWVKPSIGLGYWTRKQAEVCLLATRGKPKRIGRAISQVLHAPRREHSRKPDQIYADIEGLVDGPYMELFARQRWPGWDQWGNQVDRFEAVA